MEAANLTPGVYMLPGTNDCCWFYTGEKWYYLGMHTEAKGEASYKRVTMAAESLKLIFPAYTDEHSPVNEWGLPSSTQPSS